MASEESLWFRIGYAFERSKLGGAAARRGLAGLAERARGRAEGAGREASKLGKDAETRWPIAEDLVALGVAKAVGELVGAWRPRSHARFTGLVRAGASGAAAALLLDLVKPLIRGEAGGQGIGPETSERVLAGIAQGLVYGAVVEPRVPGPPLLKGVLFGSAEYVADPAGGLSHLLGDHTPHGRLPVVGELLDGLDPHDRAYLEHVVFGIALALLYGTTHSGNGSAPADDG